ncbi:hypothetical protein M2152_001467 [Microbacteriaceae bacterium SG_E_30_P1]|uniref:DUF6993 domain-containing protein n=1 Tax=Antiquaquibacter oligotrophicus TaxID=2880260 RepID=A0ABT6KNF5_9MICO|nr:hypothetical protein [Antiquaquibacter oligotrophicus]MDH6181285.1 hypothetical protein [Antiquaquibacter oligotrophicus]UDF13022.1 hypothetical protein LH407_12790 [Antiquaquibacter oligotrophicus]
MPRQAQRLAAIGVASLVALTLSACIGGSPDPMPVPTSSGSGTPTPTPTPTRIPIFHPTGTAAANHLFFDYVNEDYWGHYKMGPGADIVTNLANHGFNKADMEVTYDTTALNIPADSIIVSVRMQGECLIGQLSPTAYTSVIAPVLGTGKCLVGVTRPIDW